jgi:hypothetical protein
LKNMPVTAEGMEGNPEWLVSANAVYQLLLPVFVKNKKQLGKILIMSGDLDACTDKFMALVSQSLTERLVESFNPTIKEDLRTVIRTSLGRYDIFFDSPQVKLMRSNSDAKEATYDLGDLIDDPNVKRIKQTVGQHMSSSLSFPVMGAMHQAAYDKVLPDSHPRLQEMLSLTRKPSDRQFLRRLIQGGDMAHYIYGVNDRGECASRYYSMQKGPHAQNKERAYKLLGGAIRRLNDYTKDIPKELKVTVLLELTNYFVASKRYGLPKRESEAGGVEYKMIAESRNKPLQPASENDLFPGVGPLRNLVAPFIDGFSKINKKRAAEIMASMPGNSGKDWDQPIVIARILIEGPTNLGKIYMSDTQLRKRTWRAKQIPDGEYNAISMTYNTRITINEGTTEWIDRYELNRSPIYSWAVGDDHLLITRHEELIEEYKQEIQGGYNQVYSKKANFIASGLRRSGLVIAERLGVIDPRNRTISPQIYAKLKQILVERNKFSDSSWMERFPSIKSQLRGEFKESRLVNQGDLWLLIEKAQEITYYNNKRAIDSYATISIDPRLSRKVGGLEVWRGAKFEISETTMRHLRLIHFYRKECPDLLPVYMKGIKKRVNRFRTIRTEKQIKWYNEGVYPIPRKEFKDVIFKLAGFIMMMNENTYTEEVSWSTSATEIRDYVNVHYSTWEPTVAQESIVEFVSSQTRKVVLPSSEVYEAFKKEPQFLQPLPYIDEAIKAAQEDERKLFVDVETFKTFYHLKSEQENIILATSSKRGELNPRLTIDTGAGENATEKYKAYQQENAGNHLNYILDEVEKTIALNL